MIKEKLFISIYLIFVLNIPTVEVYANVADSLKEVEYNKPLTPVFEKSEWEKQTKNLKFDEDTIVKKKKEEKPKKMRKQWNLNRLKYFFISIAFALILFLIYKLIKNRGGKNLKVVEEKFYAASKLNEQEIKNLDYVKLLNEALSKGDFKTAYRVQYLQCIKNLILGRLIFYKKNDTNYEILQQLKGEKVYDSFRTLTFQFDYIWYGETEINESSYQQFLIIFNQFNEDLKAS
jgi:hypothetical protein